MAEDLPKFQYYRLRAAKDGYESAEVPVHSGGAVTSLVLHTKQETPPGMVWIPPTPAMVLRVIRLDAPPVLLQGFWLDKYEVTNRQFKQFVDAGGYQKREYWNQPFVENGKTLTWKEAMVRFRDASRRPGPATWEGGTYPDGQADYPVGA
jgi:formylglycine-generating enzyme required for sulfatase activity